MSKYVRFHAHRHISKKVFAKDGVGGLERCAKNVPDLGKQTSTHGQDWAEKVHRENDLGESCRNLERVCCIRRLQPFLGELGKKDL